MELLAVACIIPPVVILFLTIGQEIEEKYYYFPQDHLNENICHFLKVPKMNRALFDDSGLTISLTDRKI